jgi:lauroyl/myristoyl acyltransferase
MRFLLGDSAPAAEVRETSRRYVEEMVRRAEIRWHPAVATRVRLEGAEHLEEARAGGRGVVLSFMHHGLYDRSFPAVARRTPKLRMVVHPYMLAADSPRWIRQHVRLNCMAGGEPVSTAVGTDGLKRLLEAGHVLAIASDVPGRTPVTFAGREVLGSFGAGRLAWETGSPVVLMTSGRDEAGPFLRLHPALQPQRFESAHSLFETMLAEHEGAVLAWPEATDLPLSRWGTSPTVVTVR